MTTQQLIIFALGAVAGTMLTIFWIIVYMIVKGKWD